MSARDELTPSRRPLATPAQVAEYLAVTPGNLRQMRHQGTGPAYLKPGGPSGRNVRYRWDDVDAWLDTKRYTGGGSR